jgi:hypothetical protein
MKKGVLIMAGFEKFKNALKKAEEERHEELQQDIRKVRNVIEKVLSMAMENTANVARTRYSGLEMF